MSVYLRFVFAILGLGLPGALSFYYHPTMDLSLLGGLLTYLLLGLTSWSAIRFGKGVTAILKVSAVSLVASFMLIQGFDAIYILQAAPLGGRLAFLPELLLLALVITTSSLLLSRAFSRPKKQQ